MGAQTFHSEVTASVVPSYLVLLIPVLKYGSKSRLQTVFSHDLALLFPPATTKVHDLVLPIVITA